MNKETKVIVEMNLEQAELIQKSLDLYSRLQMGQLSELSSPFSIFGNRISDMDKRDEVDEHLNEIKKVLFPELDSGSYNGIFSDKTPDSSKISWDIIQVMRNKIAWHNKPEGGITVNFDKPLPSSKMELIKCKVI